MYAICVSMGVSPSYFMDEMEIFELEAIIKQYENKFKENWHQTRIIAHSIYNYQATKPIEYTDVLKFPWDNQEEEDIEIDEINLDELRKYAIEMENKLNSNQKLIDNNGR